MHLKSIFKPLLTVLAVAPLLPGCVIYSHQNQNQPQAGDGNVTFAWTFAHQTCAQNPQIATVHVDIPGETLVPSGDFACTDQGYDGITLNDFTAGDYSYTVTASDASATALFSASGTFHVDGDITVAVDLSPVAPPVPATALSFNLAATAASTTPACAEAIPGVQNTGLTDVLLSIDGAAEIDVACADGQTQNGVSVGQLAPGSHTLTARATDNTGFEYERFTGTIDVTDGAAPLAVTLAWSVGGTEFSYQLVASSVDQTCELAGIDTIYVNFADANSGTLLYPAPGNAVACSEPNDIVFPYLPVGTYNLQVTGGTESVVNSYVNTGTVPQLIISAGNFPASPVTSVELDQTN